MPPPIYDTIESLSAVDDVSGESLEFSVSNTVPASMTRNGVATGIGVIAHSAVTGPVILRRVFSALLRQQLRGRGCGQEQSARSQQRGVQKIPAGDVGIEAKGAVRARILAGRECADGFFNSAPAEKAGIRRALYEAERCAKQPSVAVLTSTVFFFPWGSPGGNWEKTASEGPS